MSATMSSRGCRRAAIDPFIMAASIIVVICICCAALSSSVVITVERVRALFTSFVIGELFIRANLNSS